MPSNWYTLHGSKVAEGDDAETIKQKEFNFKITAVKKPYFMTYVYPRLKSENDTYIHNNNRGVIRRFNQYGINSIEDLENHEDKTDVMNDYLNYYYKRIPVGNNPCVVNRISWIFEKVFKSKTISISKTPFNYGILKCGTEYSNEDYKKIRSLYKDYLNKLEKFRINNWNSKLSSDDYSNNQMILKMAFQKECEKICPNEDELCDIVLDICYSTEKSKQFAWEICGEKIIQNLLKRNNSIIHYPQLVSTNGEFTYCGNQFIMCEKEVKVN